LAAKLMAPPVNAITPASASALPIPILLIIDLLWSGCTKQDEDRP
jgi:hypothetical protein